MGRSEIQDRSDLVARFYSFVARAGGNVSRGSAAEVFQQFENSFAQRLENKRIHVFAPDERFDVDGGVVFPAPGDAALEVFWMEIAEVVEDG